MGSNWKKITKKECSVRDWNQMKMSIFNEKNAGNNTLTMGLVELGPRRALPSIRHLKTEEWMYILEGSLIAGLNNDQVRLRKGDFLFLPKKVWHSFVAGSRGVTSLFVHAPKFDWNKPDVQVKGVKKFALPKLRRGGHA